MQRLIRIIMSTLPFLIIAGLVYSAVCVKPRVLEISVDPPAIARGDLLYGVTSPRSNVIWAAGSNGKAWRSEDSGKSWTVQRTPTYENLQDIAAWNKDRAVAVGNQGVIIVTDDGGKTWKEMQAPLSRIANKLMRVRIFDNTSAWAIGEAGTVLYSKDYGVTWVRATREEDAAWNDVAFIGQKGWLVGEFGRISVSSDGGAHWINVESPVNTSLMGVTFKDALNGVAVGLDGVILVTRDGGHKWGELPKATHEHLFDVTWDGSGWAAVGDKGVLVIADASTPTLRVTRVSANDRSWHTKIVINGDHYIVTGATVHVVRKKNTGNVG